MQIDRPNQIWCADITFVPVKNGFLYLVAFMDWATRKVLSWRLSNTMHADFCVDALNEAIAKHGPPEIMNTDQGSQFTGSAWITTLAEAGLRISMDGRGRYLDNIFIERLWRSLKQEAIYLEENVKWLLGDRCYDADWFREALQDKGIRACIPGRKKRKTPVKYDKRRYKRRNRIEIMFGRLKDWRRVATRYDRCPKVFFSAIALAALVIYWL
jgi:transposase InsO family protein